MLSNLFNGSFLKHRLARLLAVAAVAMPWCARATGSIDYRPEIHGTIRARAEADTRHGEYRFQVRNARLSIAGRIAPSIDYYFNTDFCDRGKIKILDVWARMHLSRCLAFQAGQFRMPYGVEPFRSPHTYIFANRSFIGKQVCNVRAVGVKVIYAPGSLPLKIEAGAFNPTPIGDHSGWSDALAYAGKVSCRLGNVTLTTGVQSVIPDSVRANLIDGCVAWSSGRWTAEAEYMNKHYTNSTHETCHAYSLFANYVMPVNAGVFNRVSFQGRFDGMTDHSNAHRDETGCLVTDDRTRNRVTLGATIGYVRSANMFLDLRVNYEKYFYHADVAAAPGDSDKVLVELVLRF